MDKVPLYDFRCYSCSYCFEYHLPIDDRNRKILCIRCKSNLIKRLITGTLKFIITETDSPISAKDDAYWSNAEAKRLKDKTKRKAEEKEKMFYDDRYRSKIEYGKQRAASMQEN